MRRAASAPRHSSSRKNTTAPNLPTGSFAHCLYLAAQCVQAVRTGTTLPVILADLQNRTPLAWSAAMRGTVRDLATNALRDYTRGDALLARFLQKPLPELLHCALLCALPRLWNAPEHAHVTLHQTVALAEAVLPPVKGVVNAVLRRAQREEAELRTWLDEQEPTRLAYPQWWIDIIRRDHPDHWETILRTGNSKPPMTLRPNRRKADETTARAALEAAGIAHTRLGNGALLLATPRPVDQIPHFADGWFSVQDSGAQYAAALLDLHDGQRVLDACAAPGGKAAHILECANVHLTALETDAARASRIAPQFTRLGLAGDICTADARRPETWWDGTPFDRILADVPCSASGVVRRNPDSKWLRREGDLQHFAMQQAAILRALWRTLALGGKLLYVTCSLFARENREQIADFCRNHRDARLLPLPNSFPATDGQLLPSAEQDGFFYALLQKA